MKNDLTSYLPDTYKKSEVMKNILSPQQAQIEKEEKNIQELQADMHPSSTVHPELWEGEYEIEAVGTIGQRRSTIIAKMRGTGVVTKEMIRDIVEAYTEGEVKVEEDNENYLIPIEITSPSAGISDEVLMARQLREIIPAHIDFEYKFRRPIEGIVYMAAIAQTTDRRRIGPEIRNIGG